MTRRKPFAERNPHVFEIAAGAVNENDRWRGSVADLNHMLAQTVDLDEAAARRMRPLDQPCADDGDDGAGGEDFRNDAQRVMHQSTIRIKFGVKDQVFIV